MDHSYFSRPQSRRVSLYGLLWLLFQFFALPSLLTGGNQLAGSPLSALGLNLLFYTLNLAAVILIFQEPLTESAKALPADKAAVIKSAFKGFCLIYISTLALFWCADRIFPGFSNANDAAVIELSRESRLLTAAATVLLVPPAEECLFRELIFRPLYLKNSWVGYLVSAALFSSVHVLSFLGKQPPMQLLASFVIYLPAGLVLARSYAETGNIFTPILIHAAVNAASMLRI